MLLNFDLRRLRQYGLYRYGQKIFFCLVVVMLPGCVLDPVRPGHFRVSDPVEYEINISGNVNSIYFSSVEIVSGLEPQLGSKYAFVFHVLDSAKREKKLPYSVKYSLEKDSERYVQLAPLVVNTEVTYSIYRDGVVYLTKTVHLLQSPHIIKLIN